MNTLLSLTKRNEFIKTVASTATPERLTSGAISAISRLGDNELFVEATVSPSPHCMLPGDVINITGAAEDEFNGAFTILKRSADDKVIFECPGESASVTGTPVYYADVWIRQATLLGKKAARTNNVGNVYLGQRAADGEQPYELTPNGEMFLPAGREAVGPMTNLGHWYVDVLNNGDGVYVFLF